MPPQANNGEIRYGAELALKRGPSVDFTRYCQRHLRAACAQIKGPASLVGELVPPEGTPAEKNGGTGGTPNIQLIPVHVWSVCLV